jgi:hypothetical protein
MFTPLIDRFMECQDVSVYYNNQGVAGRSEISSRFSLLLHVWNFFKKYFHGK